VVSCSAVLVRGGQRESGGTISHMRTCGRVAIRRATVTCLMTRTATFGLVVHFGLDKYLTVSNFPDLTRLRSIFDRVGRNPTESFSTVRESEIYARDIPQSKRSSILGTFFLLLLQPLPKCLSAGPYLVHLPKMLLYTDILTGDEMFSDAFKVYVSICHI
jgi:hypothetical protein